MREWWYRLDDEYRVVDVGPGWDEFAMDNDSPEAVAENVMGRSFFDQVAGSPTKQLLRAIFDRAREMDGPVELPFRCDAPRVRRFMVMSPEPAEDGGLLVRTRLLGEGDRQFFPVVAQAGAPGKAPIRMCSWCQRIAVGPDHWVEPETAAQQLGLVVDEVPTISHGICPQCKAGVERGFGAGGAA